MNIPEYQQCLCSVSHLPAMDFHCRSSEMPPQSLNRQVRDSASLCPLDPEQLQIRWIKNQWGEKILQRFELPSRLWRNMHLKREYAQEHTNWLQHAGDSLSVSYTKLSGMNGSFCLFMSLMRWAPTLVLTISLLPLASNLPRAAS